jgi:signal transduction histidine kinase
MMEVFVNIIENAIDAMPAGGELEISSRWRSKDPKGAELVFSDNGKGIPEAQLKMIFTPNFTTKKEGFGIGLPVCQRIVLAHDGSLAVESREGIGTKIAIFIPGELPGAQK